MKILVVYRGLPWPIWEGYHLRILHLFRRLADRHELQLLSLLHLPEQDAELDALRDEGIFEKIHLRWLPKRSAWGRLRTNLGLGAVSAFQAEYPGFARQLAQETGELVRREGIDVGYVFDTWADLWFSESLELPTLLDVCDCRSFFYERRLERDEQGVVQRWRTRQLLRRFRQYESHLLKRYPMSTVVSPLDRDYLRGMHPGARVEVIPNGVDLEMFHPLEDVPEVPGNLVFFGNMDFLPNVDAAVTFARGIFPLVRKRHSESTFTVLGSNPVPEVQALAELSGVEVTGRVEDLKPWISRAQLLVAYMRFGAGIKNKVLEAMAMEKAVVTNSTGLEAMKPAVRELLALADDPQSFADAVCGLLEDAEERQRRGRLGRECMREHHSWDRAAQDYESLLTELASDVQR